MKKILFRFTLLVMLFLLLECFAGVSLIVIEHAFNPIKKIYQQQVNVISRHSSQKPVFLQNEEEPPGFIGKQVIHPYLGLFCSGQGNRAQPHYSSAL